MEIKNVALIGMGAIGTVYGNILYKKLGENFAVIAGESRAEKLKSSGFTINNSTFHPQIVSSTEKGTKFDLIIFCVKNYQLEEAIEDVKHFVNENTIMIPLLNGVTARDRIKTAYPNNNVLYGLSMRIDAVRTNNGVVNTENGEIQFGNADNTIIATEVTAVQEFFNRVGIKNKIFTDMIRTMWKKWMLNIGANQVSAITKAPYGKLTTIYTNLALFKEAMMEVIEVAHASNVDLREEDINDFVTLMNTFSPNGKTSMLQDIEAKRLTEVDYFAGTLIELGKKFNIQTPVNYVLYCVIKSMEELYSNS
nr:ketopantoate reductase family protein [Sedimentibacter sp.]